MPGSGFGDTLSASVASIKSGQPQQWLGHNPLGRLAVVLILLMLISQAVTSLILSSSDIY